MSQDAAVRKVRVLRAWLSAFESRRTISDLSVDVTTLDRISFAGGDWVHLQHYLAPEVLLGLDGAKKVPVFLVVTSGLEPDTVNVTPTDLDDWLNRHTLEEGVVDVSTALNSLGYHASTDLSKQSRVGAERLIKSLRSIFKA